MRKILTLLVISISFFGCENTNHYTDGYQYKYRRPIGLIMSHELGRLSLTGEGVKIGVIDAGYGGFLTDKYTKNLKVKDYKDFIDHDTTDFFTDKEHSHGTKVTSSIGGKNGEYVHGLAFEATYFLAKTEDVSSELAAEEKRLIDAVDWLVSKNVDIINISIAYTVFDDTEYYSKTDLDGKTALSSKHIDSVLLANPDLIITASAGNKGNKEWTNIMFPSDVKEVITVGSTDFEGQNRWKSSGIGPENLGYIKPDVVTYPIPSGNSHTAPVIAGLSALIKEKYPNLERTDFIEALHMSGSNAKQPNLEIGYGIPQSKELLMNLK
jgi:subtilisin family serine protease